MRRIHPARWATNRIAASLGGCGFARNRVGKNGVRTTVVQASAVKGSAAPESVARMTAGKVAVARKIVVRWTGGWAIGGFRTVVPTIAARFAFGILRE
jgi:hypothetical protein